MAIACKYTTIVSMRRLGNCPLIGGIRNAKRVNRLCTKLDAIHFATIYITCTQFARQFIHAACSYSVQFNAIQ